MQKEINRLLKKISSERLKNNHKECIELYNIVGGLYSDIGSYDEAIHYHEQALELCKTIGDRLGSASAMRYIGEAKAALGQFFQAIEYIKRYLELAQRTNNKVEIQRAWTTLGRVYLMQAQDLKDQTHTCDDKIKETAKEAERRFQTALNLAESVRDQVDAKEFAQMKSGLLINIGLVNDICGQHSESIGRLNKAAEICRAAKLKEDLYRCQVIMAGIFRQRSNVKMAVKTSDEALALAKSIGKKLLICDAYIERGLVKICQRDFKGAKRTFAQAYLEKSPSEEDHSKAIRLTKLAHLISVNYDKLSQNESASDSRMRICDKLGDLFVAINSYKLAIEFYKRALSDAKVSLRPKAELAKILYSIAETYADDGQFDHARLCYEKELTYRNGNDVEQCQSLIKIAHMYENLDQDQTKTSEAYEKALDKAGKNPKLLYNVLKYYVEFLQKKSFNLSRCKELENVLLNLKSYPEVIEEMEAEDCDELNDLEDEVANVDDIITDDEGNDEVLMVGRKRSRGPTRFKPNEVGDTPLHEACIKGDLKRVKSLISQGHEVNPRDNAGWIPLHEACNHGHYQIVDFLIENGADVSNRGLKGMSPLHDAATNGHYDIMRLLMRNGANVIALTDTGETVLSCLRDHKKRNYSDMSNQEMAEYKLMEAELLNAMDKCGFNLMEESIKNLGTSRNKSSSKAFEDVRPKPRNLMSALDPNSDQVSHPVAEYRNTMGILKRRRLNEDRAASPERANLPATVESGLSTSAPTKEWLIDDTSKKNQIFRRRQPIHDTLGSSDDDESDRDERASFSRQPNPRKQSRANCRDLSPRHQKQKDKSANRRRLLESDDEEDGEDLFGDPCSSRGSERCNANRASKNDEDVVIIEEDEIELTSQRSPPDPLLDIRQVASPPISWSSCGSLSNFNNLTNNNSDSNHNNNTSSNHSNFTVHRFDLFSKPLTVAIEDRKLLIPVRDDNMTIKSLKESIIERYSILVNAQPNINIAPVSDPGCFFYERDLCKDVIRENVVAIIESWRLNSLEQSYVENCSRENIDPLVYVKLELRRIDEQNNQELDLSYTRFPRSHIKSVAASLALRDFNQVNLTGASTLFDCQLVSQNMLECILTWKKLTRLCLKCVGLRRQQFESICNKMKLPELKSLDASVNSLAYKCKDEFRDHIERLLVACPKLKRLDVRRNHLKFVKSIWPQPGALKELPPSGTATTAATTTLDLSELLGLKPLELLGSDQNEYSVYSTV